jgi:hypothetical protein
LLLHVRRRYKDTHGFVTSVMKPGSLQAGGAGQMWIRRVRLTHAAVRRAMREKSKPAQPQPFRALWHSLDLVELQLRGLGAVKDEMHLDQIELALVLQTFAWCMVEGLGKMGWGMSRAEAADHVHAWSAIGWMMGIDQALLPRGAKAVAEAENLFVLIRDYFLRPGDPLGRDPDDGNDTKLAGRLLVAAWITFLVQVQRESTPENLQGLLRTFPRIDEALQQLPRILVRRLCGDEAARYLRIGHAGLFDRFICWLALLLIDVRGIAAQVDVPPNDALSAALV